MAETTTDTKPKTPPPPPGAPGEERDNPLDSLRNPPPVLIEVYRHSSDGRRGQRGFCGTVPLVGGYKGIIAERWGGGFYEIRGRASDGSSVGDAFELPGEPKPLVESDDDDPPPLGFGVPGQYMPGQYGPPWAGVPWPGPYGQAPFGQGHIPWQAYQPQSSAETERLRAENNRLQAELAHERTRAEALRDRYERELREVSRQLAAESEARKLEALRAEQSQRLAELELRLGAGSKGQDTNTLAMVEMSKANTQILTALIKAQQNPAELLQLVKERGGSLKDTTQVLELLGALKEFMGKNDDSWQGVARTVAQETLPALWEVLGGRKAPAQTNPQRQLPDNGQDNGQAAKQEPTTEDGMTNERWAALLREAAGYCRANNDPTASATHFVVFCRGLWRDERKEQAETNRQAIGFLQKMAKESAADLRASVGQGLNHPLLSEGPLKASLREFHEVTGTEQGLAWLGKFLQAVGKVVNG